MITTQKIVEFMNLWIYIYIYFSFNYSKLELDIYAVQTPIAHCQDNYQKHVPCCQKQDHSEMCTCREELRILVIKSKK